MGAVYELTLRQLAGRWRLSIMTVLAAMPVLIAAVMLRSNGAPSVMEFENSILSAMLAGSIAPLVVLAIAAAAFVWLGLVSAQAVGLGLLYIVLWEGFFAGFVSGVRLLSIRYHAIALMHGLDARRFDTVEHASLAVTLSRMALTFAGFVWLTVRRLRRMDVP